MLILMYRVVLVQTINLSYFRRIYYPIARSWRSSFILLAIPPAYPVSAPHAPITRWHGIMIDIGLRPTAAPMARDDFGWFSFFAISPYVVVWPYGMSHNARQTLV